MKTLFAVALLASIFTFTSCGNKPADTTNTATTTTPSTTPTAAPAAPASFADKAADCTCEMLNSALKMKKEIEAAPADKKEEVAKKASEAMKEPACMAALEAEAQKVPEADKAKIEIEVKAAIEKKCGAVMKELEMPAN